VERTGRQRSSITNGHRGPPFTKTLASCAIFMKRTDYSLIVLWVIVCAAMALVVSGVIYIAADILTETMKVVVGTVGALIAAIFSHALAQARELEQKRQQAMQSNYEKLLERISSAIRSGDDPDDAFSTAHLQSWVFGTPEVVRKTQEILKATDKEGRKAALRALVQAMRKDVGLEVDDKLPLELIFKERKTTGI
jgi:Flp pilus assembly protein TadB